MILTIASLINNFSFTNDSRNDKSDLSNSAINKRTNGNKKKWLIPSLKDTAYNKDSFAREDKNDEVTATILAKMQDNSKLDEQSAVKAWNIGYSIYDGVYNRLSIDDWRPIIYMYLVDFTSMCCTIAAKKTDDWIVDFTTKKQNVIMQALMQINIKNPAINSMINFYKQCVIVNLLYGLFHNTKDYFINSYYYDKKEVSKLTKLNKQQIETAILKQVGNVLDTNSAMWVYYTDSGLVIHDDSLLFVTAEQLEALISFILEHDREDYVLNEHDTLARIIPRIIRSIYSFCCLFDYYLHLINPDEFMAYLDSIL